MKISYNWIKRLLPVDHTPEEISVYLTDCGLEVEGIEKFESIKGGLKQVVIGEVLECEKHPDADRLKLTKVNVGEAAPLSIVCGAPNVAKGQKVIVAKVGAILYPVSGEPLEIKKSKIRGAVSEGMICAEDEIGLGTSHDGIMVLDAACIPGTAAAEHFKLTEDYIFEIGLTPNRSDAASHLGVARDLAAVLNCRTNSTEWKTRLIGAEDLEMTDKSCPIKIDLLEKELCKRYSGIYIQNITVKDSPEWLKNSLKSIGLRPINNIVDITNYVLHELGQPLHAFDAQKIKGNKLIIRKAFEAERFVTLDGVERKLQADDLMIANRDESMCIAGVFGGLDSGVNNNTTSLFLESAYFDAGSIRKSSKFHSLKTDASFRFERGTDPEMTITALNRATRLILELAGGEIGSGIIDLYPEELPAYQIAFSYSRCDQLIGKVIDRNTIKNILTSLNIEIVNEGTDALLLRVPLFKTDVSREIDVIEEIMRVYGYNHIEQAQQVKFSVSYTQQDHAETEKILAEFLAAQGFYEMMNTSLTNENYYTSNESIGNNLVKIVNPLSSDLNVMRASMLYSGLETISYNLNRKNINLKLFEFGRTYHQVPSGNFNYSETRHLSLFLTGKKQEDNAHGHQEKVNFFQLKAYVENMFKRLGLTSLSTEESEDAQFDHLFSYFSGKRKLASLGAVNKNLCKKQDIQQEVFFADLLLDEIYAAMLQRKALNYVEVSKFPYVKRDLALLIDKKINYSEIEKLVQSTERKLLKEIRLFDIYEGDKLERGKKSYAISLTLADETATLTDKQIEQVMQKIIKACEEKLGASLRI